MYNFIIASKYPIDKSVPVLSLPPDRADEDLYKVSPVTSFGWDYSFPNIALYNVDEKTFIPEVIVVDGASATSIEGKSKTVVFDKITRAIDDKGERIIKIYLFEDGGDKSNNTPHLLIKDSSFVIFDSARDELSRGAISHIREEDRVVIRKTYNTVNLVLIIR